MKFTTLLSFLTLTTGITFALPSSPAEPGPPTPTDLRNFAPNTFESHDAANITLFERRQNPANPNHGGTIQNWVWSSTCSPGNAQSYVWHPAYWTNQGAPDQACYSQWEAGVQQRMLSIMFTGSNWGPNCHLRGYFGNGCVGQFSVFPPNTCGSRGSNGFWSLNVHCG
ncbi:hypothetical protein QBC38DRAFT_455959 [Podospora fimiseda]|uniref:Uncharacterized protein n=1 Tax=Podospora fimiseda TaxID=252190 RepID=A0AAN7GXZ4_9PEZI|nr:hypothetical protein QBC38DRAFT_455959 [Podospora fimiseda]